jgi:hypothetical protein
MMVPVVMPVAGSTTVVGTPGSTGVLEPGTWMEVTDTVEPGGATTASSMLPVAGTPGVVVSEAGGTTSTGTAWA